MNQKQKYPLRLFLFIFLTILYLELIFKIRLFENISLDLDYWKMSLFAVSYTSLVMFFLMFFKKRTAYILLLVVISFTIFTFINQELYNSILHQFYSFSFAGDITKGLSFFNKYFSAIRFGMIAYLLPINLLLLFCKVGFLSFDVEYQNTKQPLIVILFTGFIFFISLQTINQKVQEEYSNVLYSDMDLYTFMYNPQRALKTFGLVTYTQRDFFSLFRTNPLTKEDQEVLLKEYLDTKYLDDPHPDYYPYTGLFSDKVNNKKNFILIMAESLDTFAIDENITPTLYEFSQTGAYFVNYYSPLYYRSTADTEFLVQTSMYPNKNVTLSMEEYLGNTFPYTFPKLFKEKGYNTYSFHNYTDYFYPRSEFHRETLGFDYYFGAVDFNMLPAPIGLVNNHEWQSDLEMFEKSLNARYVDENGNVDYIRYLEDDYFFVNYLTVSGHFNYTDEHNIAKNYADQLEQYYINTPDLERPDDKIFYYLASNMDLDLGLEYLKEQLIEAGKWDDTVIMIFGDHYAYGIDDNLIWDYDTIKSPDKTNLDMEIHNVPMIICSGSGTTLESASCDGNPYLKGNIQNYMSSVDILPTVANLFDLNLNYKYTFGEDALRSSANNVRFSDTSFINQFVSYDSLSEEYTYSGNFILPEGYTINMFLNDETISPPEGYTTKEEYIDDYMSTYLLIRNAEMIKDYQYNVSFLELDYLKPSEEEE